VTLVLPIICLCSGVISLVFLCILANTTGKRFDKLLIKSNIKLPVSAAFTLPQNYGRENIYAVFMLSRGKLAIFGKKNAYRKQLMDFDFAGRSTRLDMTLAGLYYFWLLVFFVFLGFFFVFG